MKNIIKCSVSAIVLTILLSFYAVSGSKVIYGDDNRLEYYSASADKRVLADSVVSLWRSQSLVANEGWVGLRTTRFSDALGLCPGERFAEQPTGPFCSGSLVGEDLIMTAGHCIRNESSCVRTRFVFGFAIKEREGSAPYSVFEGEVYSCKEIVAHFLDGRGADYTVLRLDRPVAGRRPLRIHRGASLKEGDGLFVIGHPSGLPVKIAGDARVRGSHRNTHYITDLDTYAGNSGSPVFDSRTNLVVGILVRGETDFITTPEGCRRSNVIGQNEGRGEDVTKVALVADAIPDLADYNRTARIPSRRVELGDLRSIRDSLGGQHQITIPSIQEP